MPDQKFLTEAQMTVLCELAVRPGTKSDFSGMTLSNLTAQRFIIIMDRGGWDRVVSITAKGRDRIDGIIGEYKRSFGVAKVEELEETNRKLRGEIKSLKARMKRQGIGR